MPIIVNLPDGSKASFPDGTPPEAMKSAIQKRFPNTKSNDAPHDLVSQAGGLNLETLG